MLACCAAACPTPSSAAASPGRPAIAETISEGYAEGANRLTVEVAAPRGADCTLRVVASRSSRSFPAVRVRRLRPAVWRWPVPAPAQQGAWAFTARCTTGGVFAWRTRVVEPGIPSRAGALAALRATGPFACDAQGLCLSGDAFEVGQCTWYAIGRRPDLLGAVAGNAGTWLDAAAGRVPEGSRPVGGALAVWRAGRTPAGPLGHVAFVAKVLAGRVLVYDSNWQPTPTSAPLQVHEHWISAAAPSGYIYGGPAGAGPVG
jgi:hypothetical protein